MNNKEVIKEFIVEFLRREDEAISNDRYYELLFDFIKRNNHLENMVHENFLDFVLELENEGIIEITKNRGERYYKLKRVLFIEEL